MRPLGRGPAVLSPVKPHTAAIIRTKPTMASPKVGRVAANARSSKRTTVIICTLMRPRPTTAKTVELVLQITLGTASKTRPAGAPATAKLASVLITTMDTAKPSSAAPTQEPVPRELPTSKTSYAVRNPTVLITPATRTAGTAPSPANAITRPPGTPRHAALKALAFPTRGVLTLPTRTPETGRGQPIIVTGTKRRWVDIFLTPGASKTSVTWAQVHPRKPGTTPRRKPPKS